MYYKHIDGLRAIAVLAVIFVHLDISLYKVGIPLSFSGGYVGVDVFFVISGFLITNIIMKEIRSTGSFSFINFYTRRVRRILPALTFVMILSFIFSVWLLNLAKFKVFGGSLATAAISFSNIFFYNQAGYFDIFSQSSPLLHTWSLGVEEQFYIFWPIALLVVSNMYCLFKGKYRQLVIPFIIAVFSISLLCSIHRQDTNINSLYYLAPFRAFEFCIGGILVWLLNFKSDRNILNETLCTIGLLLIFYSIFTYNSTTLFPSYNALPPTIGAVLLIYAGTAKYSGAILRNKAIGFIGLISYSLYLIHWPIIVFMKTYNEDATGSFSITTKGKLIAIVLSFIIATLMYYFIEQPFRKNIPKIKIKQIYLLLRWSIVVVVIIALGTSIFYSKGWLWRANSPVAVAKIDNIATYHQENWGGAGFSPQGLKYGKLPANIILMGDSHSGMLETGIVDEIAKPYNLSVYGISGGHGVRPDSSIQKYTSSLLLPGISAAGSTIWPAAWNDKSTIEASIDLQKHINGNDDSILIYSVSYPTINASVFLSNHKSLDIDINTMDKYVQYKPFTKALDRLKDIIGKHNLILIGQTPGSQTFIPTSCMSRLKWFHPKNTCKAFQDKNVYQGGININKILKEYASKHEGVYFINPYDTFCKGGMCQNLDKNGTPFYSDGNHLSKTGSIFFIKNIKNELLRIMRNNHA
ncbi:acyltransferase family protein [Francisella philomiragia]|uniref:acyltransferase family protein n=1 Tax=Francisella philomiragia TaxID=28110 RepID=UPI001906BEDB|nr:acyltransferase family protein [Francisella philomiragia]MBK2092376.1 acyltransferase [Francisella philomiragia]MBK2257403.1 acyltransferase [Francisella philomiragia]MBK2270097.1 acyltransferase [Francisella philomiragia]MBK2271998.1 acyltransferase [Francisella philomiragia]MBK2275779.1 acyltransferase [Francisella philomiragia]